MKKFGLLVTLALFGCHPSRAELRDVVVEGRALLADRAAGQVQDSAWQKRRALFLVDADTVAPEKS